MRRSDRILTYAAAGLATGGGVVYGWARYFGGSEDEFGPVQHAWVPTLQAFHVLSVPAFVFVLGLLWRDHILSKLSSGAKSRRRTGILLLSQSLLMVASGYALQVSVGGGWREVWLWGHLTTSVSFVLAMALHLAASVK